MKIECEMKDVFESSNGKLQSPGLLLTSSGEDGSINVMTIGWGLMGRLWTEPVFMIAVRPSRHTFKLIEETLEFTVNIPADEMNETVAYCGRVSGRDHNKFKDRSLSVIEGNKVKSPLIENCIGHFECRVIGKSKVVPGLLSGEVKNRHYQSDDYHTLYYGMILSTMRER